MKNIFSALGVTKKFILTNQSSNTWSMWPSLRLSSHSRLEDSPPQPPRKQQSPSNNGTGEEKLEGQEVGPPGGNEIQEMKRKWRLSVLRQGASKWRGVGERASEWVLLSVSRPACLRRVGLLEVTGQSGACAAAGVHTWRLRANQLRPDQLYQPNTCCTSAGCLASSLHRRDSRVFLGTVETRC